jgi:hypothetical protein
MPMTEIVAVHTLAPWAVKQKIGLTLYVEVIVNGSKVSVKKTLGHYKVVLTLLTFCCLHSKVNKND